MDILHNQEQGAYRPVPLKGHRPPQPDDNWPYKGRPNTPHDKQYGIKDPKFERHLYIERDQIFYDLDAQISMMSRARRKDDGTEDDPFVNATTTYQQQFFRWIDKHIGVAKSVMSAFVLEPSLRNKMNSISQQEEVDITLLTPMWYDDTVFAQLCQAVHDYVVNATLYEFFSISLLIPTRHGVTQDPATIVKQQQMEESLNDVRKYLNASKPGMIHKHLAPF